MLTDEKLEDMERVCSDEGSVWYYCASEQKYYRVYKSSREYSFISGRNLPNPNDLLEVRRNMCLDIGGNIDQIKPPTEATKALYDHWVNQDGVV